MINSYDKLFELLKFALGEMEAERAISVFVLWLREYAPMVSLNPEGQEMQEYFKHTDEQVYYFDR